MHLLLVGGVHRHLPHHDASSQRDSFFSAQHLGLTSLGRLTLTLLSVTVLAVARILLRPGVEVGHDSYRAGFAVIVTAVALVDGHIVWKSAIAIKTGMKSYRAARLRKNFGVHCPNLLATRFLLRSTFVGVFIII